MKKNIRKQTFFSLLLVFCMLFQSISFAFANDVNDISIQNVNEQSSDIVIDKDDSNDGKEEKISGELIKDPKDELKPRALVNEVESSEDSEIPNKLELLEVKNSESSKDLKRFLKQLTIDGAQQNGDTYIIDPGKNYSIKLKFQEDEKLQFDDTDEMKYTFPDGVKIVNAGPGNFDIKIVDSQGEATILGNEFEFKDNSVIVRFNKKDPNYPRLSAVGNASFEIGLKVKISKNDGQYEFAPGFIKKFEFETNSDLEIKKEGVYNKDKDQVDYTLTIKSIGTNNEVVIKDDIKGTALKYNKDVRLENSIGENIVNNEGGFEIKIPKLEDEQEVVVKYSAKVLYDKLVNNGTNVNTNNEASVSSKEVTEPKIVKNHLAGKIVLDTLKKTGIKNLADISGQPGYKSVKWSIEINTNKKLDLSNKRVIDLLDKWETKRTRFIGEGIKVKIEGKPEKVVKWEQLENVKRDKVEPKEIYGWEYVFPSDTGKSKVTIEAETKVNTNDLFGELSVGNKVTLGENSVTGSVKFTPKEIGIGEEGLLSIEKKAKKINEKEIEWEVKVHVIKAGYPELVFVDDFPSIFHEGKNYNDELVYDSFEVDGLIEGESFKPNKELYINPNTGRQSIGANFYKNKEQTEKGLKPHSEDRDIIIRFRSKVNQDILDIAHKNGYDDDTAKHKNNVSIRSLDMIDSANATAIPKKRSISKDVVEQSSVKIDDVSYPIFGYEVILSGVSQEPTEVIDKFDTKYLKLYEIDGIELIPMENENNKIKIEKSEIENIGEGIKINIKSFPKKEVPNEGKRLYNDYKLKYTLIAKDKDTLEKMKEEAKKNNGVLKLENTATWDNVESDKNTAICNYAPFVGKEQAIAPSAGNKYKATFKVVINEHATKLDPNNSSFDVEDVLSDNLRLIPSSIKIDPDNLGINVGVDGNKITFKNVPDETKVVIVYEVEVLGAAGDITYFNTIKLGKYEVKVEDTVTKEISGGGSGSNPSITLVKTDKDNINKYLSGAEFQLFRVNQGNEEPVVDKNNENVTFTTKDNGKVLIEGDKDKLGWVLWTGVEYHLKEIKAPKGYNLRTEPVKFILKEQPAGGIEYEYIGKELNNVTNERPKIDIEANKNWVNGPSDRPDIWFKLYRQLEGSQLEEVTEASIKKLSSGTTKVKWEGMYSHNLEMKPYKFVVKEVNADGSDFTPENYKKDGDGNENNHYTIKNTYESPKIEITGTKIWEHGPQAHPTIKLQLYKNGQKEGEPVVLPNGKTTHKWTNLDKTDINGVDYKYTVDEVEVPNGYEKTKPNDLTVKNTYIQKKKTIKVTKKWDIGNLGNDITKPEIKLTLYRKIDNQELQKVPGADEKIIDGTNLVAEWKDLEAEDINGNPYKFYVKESFKNDDVTNENWTIVDQTEILDDGNGKITNKLKDPKGKLTIKKILKNEQEIIRTARFRSVGVQKKDEQKVFKFKVTGPYNFEEHFELKAGENKSFDNLYFGEYKVEETDSQGFKVSYSADGGIVIIKENNVNETVTVTNSNEANVLNISVLVKKIWKGGSSDKPNVTLELWRRGKNADGTVIDEKVNTFEAQKDSLSHTFTQTSDGKKLAMYDPSGRKFEYYVKEINVPDNYEVSYSKEDIQMPNEISINVTNTYVSPKIKVTGKKIWEHGPQTHPTIKLQLYRNGQKLGEPVELPNGKTTHEWTDLDKTDVNGVDYEYKVDEVDVPDNYNKTNPDALTVKNTYVSPNTDITATKIWEGGTKVKPTIWFKLYRNIEGGNSEEVSGIAIQKLENGTDKVTWKGLPETDTKGNKYIYTVKEVDADGKDYEPKNYKKSEEGLKVTNKFTSPKITREVIKEWIGAKADSVKVKLLADGKEIQEIELNNSNNWKHTFEGLDKYAFDDGHEIVYSFKEVGEENGKLRIGGKVYDVSYTGDKIINKAPVEESNIGKDNTQSPRLPRTGDSNLTTISAIAIASIAAILIAYDSKRKYSKK